LYIALIVVIKSPFASYYCDRIATPASANGYGTVYRHLISTFIYAFKKFSFRRTARFYQLVIEHTKPNETP
jgi:hypothetical protein